MTGKITQEMLEFAGQSSPKESIHTRRELIVSSLCRSNCLCRCEVKLHETEELARLKQKATQFLELAQLWKLFVLPPGRVKGCFNTVYPIEAPGGSHLHRG